jgi:hypothetical protein
MTSRRDPNDPRDDQELAEIATILETFPRNHRARLAFRMGAETIELSRLVGDPELARRLVQACLDGRDRIFSRNPHFRP